MTWPHANFCILKTRAEIWVVIEPRKVYSVTCCSFCFQQSRKQRQAEEDKGATSPPAVCDDEASIAGFTDVPLSLPYQGTEGQQQGPAQDQPSEEQQTSSSQTLSASIAQSLQTSLTFSTVQLPEPEIEESDEVRVEDHGTELRDAPQTTEAWRENQTWTQPCVSTQLENPPAPSAPALYPSLSTLEEGPLMQLREEALRPCGTKGPAVLALTEQESSPPSLQPLESGAELSRGRLYPELPKTAPELQVTTYTDTHR